MELAGLRGEVVAGNTFSACRWVIFDDEWKWHINILAESTGSLTMHYVQLKTHDPVQQEAHFGWGRRWRLQLRCGVL
jgi:hypothetical protein